MLGKAWAEKLADAAKVSVPEKPPETQKALEPAGEAQSGKSAEANRASVDWACQAHSFRQRMMLIGGLLLAALQRSQKAKEDLVGILTCSVSKDIFSRPVFAPDGQVYEGISIRRWLRTNPRFNQ